MDQKRRISRYLKLYLPNSVKHKYTTFILLDDVFIKLPYLYQYITFTYYMYSYEILIFIYFMTFKLFKIFLYYKI